MVRNSYREFSDHKAFLDFRGSTGSVNDPIPTPYLRSVRAQVMSNLLCTVRYPIYISSSNICTTVAIGTPCDGDEGGALTYVDDDRERTQIGIFSYQYSLGCDRGWPRKFQTLIDWSGLVNHHLIISAVFTRVTSYLSWIESNSGAYIRP